MGTLLPLLDCLVGELDAALLQSGRFGPAGFRDGTTPPLYMVDLYAL